MFDEHYLGAIEERAAGVKVTRVNCAFTPRELIAGVPYLHITTDYSENNSGQLRTRIEAFLELLS